jgi:hypothetical protein
VFDLRIEAPTVIRDMSSAWRDLGSRRYIGGLAEKKLFLSNGFSSKQASLLIGSPIGCSKELHRRFRSQYNLQGRRREAASEIAIRYYEP